MCMKCLPSSARLSNQVFWRDSAGGKENLRKRMLYTIKVTKKSYQFPSAGFENAVGKMIQLENTDRNVLKG